VSTATETLAQVELDQVGVTYPLNSGVLNAIESISLSIPAGQFVSIVGPSGCGKSTLLRVIGGLQAPTRGSARIQQEGPERARRQKRVGYVFQDPTLLPWRSVRRNVELPLEVNRVNGSEDPTALLNRVGLSGFEVYYPHQLSGGMQQRVALARALVTAPALLLMDEPFGSLDEISRSAMRYELLRIWQAEESPRTVIFVTHSIPEAVLLSDRVIVLTPRPGRIAADVRISLPRPRDEDIEMSPAYLEHCRELRASLREWSPA